MDTNTKTTQTANGTMDARAAIDLLLGMSNGVTTVAKIKGLTPNQLETFYSIGSSYYETGKYAEAEKIFAFLCMIDHIETKYWTALGAARQAQRKYKEAMESYAAGALFKLHAPKPHFYAAQCALALGDTDAAISGCRSVLKYVPAGEPENNAFRAKAEEMLKTLLEPQGK